MRADRTHLREEFLEGAENLLEVTHLRNLDSRDRCRIPRTELPHGYLWRRGERGLGFWVPRELRIRNQVKESEVDKNAGDDQLLVLALLYSMSLPFFLFGSFGTSNSRTSVVDVI